VLLLASLLLTSVLVADPAAAAGLTATSAVSTSAMALGDTVTDTATLAGGTNPGGAVEFFAFGPDNPTCSGTAPFTSLLAVHGDGTYTSDAFTPFDPGVYRFTVFYSGDPNNAPLLSGCNDPNESVTVAAAPPGLVTQASGPPAAGGTISDAATLSGGTNPTGTISFDVFGPDDPTCTGTPAFTSMQAVAGDGDYTSDPVTPTADGTWRFVASYSGDANNPAVATSCADPTESVAVGGTPPTTTTAPGTSTTTTTVPPTTTTTTPGTTTTTTPGTTTTTITPGTTTSTVPGTTTTTGGGGTTTTTTAPGTTTTIIPGTTTTTLPPGTTTTIPGTTTTTAPGTTTTTTGTGGGTTTTTTAGGGTTTTTVHGGGATTTTTGHGSTATTAATGGNSLPRTGTSPLRIVLFGLVLLLSGETLRKAARNLG